MAFEDKYLQTVVATIVRINDRTASLDPGDRTKWQVGFSLLRHVLDVLPSLGCWDTRLLGPR